MSPEIRRIRADEYDTVGELIVGSYHHNGYLTKTDGSFDDDYAEQLRGADLRNRDAEVWIAVDGNEILGCVTWCQVGSPFRELAVEDSQAEFRGLAVTPAARGRGTGRALVEYCLRRARDENFGEVVICSLPDMTPAHALYESVGFSRRPDLDWSPTQGVTLWGFSVPLEAGPTRRRASMFA